MVRIEPKLRDTEDRVDGARPHERRQNLPGPTAIGADHQAKRKRKQRSQRRAQRKQRLVVRNRG